MLIDFQWITIPAGAARVGSTLDEVERAVADWADHLLEEAYEPEFRSWLLKETPQHLVQLASFAISDTPITNRMYAQFVEQTGAKRPESLTRAQVESEIDHPVWGVSLEDARQFCRWLSDRLGCSISLPTEAQWERAARGDTGREYPWGDGWSKERCNSIEAKVENTTPVRRYEEGRSLFGLYDMGGNVEEWVDSPYQVYPGGQVVVDDLYEALGPDYPILKGGSFARGGDLCRVARRHGPFPEPVFRFTGFRVVREV